VGVLLVPLLGIGDADLSEHVDRHRFRLAFGEPAVEFDELPQLAADGEDGVERLHRILEDHRDLVAPDSGPDLLVREHVVALSTLPIGPLFEAHDGLALVGDFAADDLAGVFDEPQEAHRGDRFAGAAFSDEADDFALADLEGDAVDGAYCTGFRKELRREILDAKEWFRAHC